MSWDGFQRVGHGGASALAPANTLASFDAAAAVGIDMVEFDVREWGGQLMLAHTIFHARRGGNVLFEDALAHLAGERFAGIELNVDVKHSGFESRLLDELRGAGLLDRTLVSSQMTAVIDRIRGLDPQVRTGISVGGRLARWSRRWEDWRSEVLTGLSARRWDALMVQHRQVDSGLVHEVGSRQGRLYAWTVNERGAIDALRGLGVDGIATSDPRLFGTAAP